MKIETVTAIVFSPTGGSAKNLYSIASVLDPNFAKIDLTAPGAQPAATSFGPNDLVLIGVPVYVGRVAAVAMQRLEPFRGSSTPCVLTATFGNRAYEDALLELSDWAKAHGFVPVAAAGLNARHSFGEIQADRPNAADLAQNAAFAAQLKEKLASLDPAAVQLAVPGNTPYREGGRGRFASPSTSDACVHCGICVEGCPTAAINAEDQSLVDTAKCLSCFLCIRNCPTGAKQMTDPQYVGMIDKFSAMLATPNTNDYIL